MFIHPHRRNTQSSSLSPEQNVRFLDPREDRLTHDSSDNFWKQKPSRGNESVETVRSEFPDKILQIRATRNIDFEKGYKNTTEGRRTLMDFNGPVIMEDLDDTTDQDVSSHVRVKRNEPIVHHRSSSTLVDSFPWNFRCSTDVISVFGDSTFKGSRSDRENRPGIVMDIVTSRSRRKRGVLPKSRYRRKHVKGNVEHPKHHAKIRNGKKKHDVLKFSHQPAKKKMSNPSSSMFSYYLSFQIYMYIGSYIHTLLNTIRFSRNVVRDDIFTNRIKLRIRSVIIKKKS